MADARKGHCKMRCGGWRVEEGVVEWVRFTTFSGLLVRVLAESVVKNAGTQVTAKSGHLGRSVMEWTTSTLLTMANTA